MHLVLLDGLNFYLHRLQQAICAADLFPGHACSCGGVLPIWSASLLWQREQLGYAHEALPSPCGLNTYCTSQQCCSIFCFYEKVPFFFFLPMKIQGQLLERRLRGTCCTNFCVLYGSWGSTLIEMRLNHTLSVSVCSRQCDWATWACCCSLPTLIWDMTQCRERNYCFSNKSQNVFTDGFPSP